MLQYSFIIPVYNCEKYLESCVLSILKQTENYDFEIVLIDDGSLDKGGSIADELADRYYNVRTFHKENGGAASARNKGISVARGKYILFIDGDDTISSSLLDVIDYHLGAEECDMIIYGMSFEYYRHEKIERSEKVCCEHNGRFTVNDILESYPVFFYDNALSSACNKVFKTEVIRERHIRFNEEMSLYEDYDFVLQYLRYINNVYCIAKPFYYYRHDLENIHLNHRVRDLVKVQQSMRNLLETSSNVYRQKENKAVSLMEVTGNLYMQLLVQNLMNQRYSLQKLRTGLTEYCNESSFRKLCGGEVNLRKDYRQLLVLVDSGRFWTIKLQFAIKKFVSKTKKVLKRQLNIWRIRG